MNLRHTLTAFALTIAALTTAHAEVQPRSQRFTLGRLAPTDTVEVYMEYPELRRLTRSEAAELRRQGFTATEDVHYDVTLSTARGKRVADVNFIPVVSRDGRWYAIEHYDLKIRVVGPRLSAAVRSIMVNIDKAQSRARYASHSVLATGRWVKIRVKDEGIYQLTTAELSKMGFKDPSRVKLYGYGGRLLPESFSFSGKDGLIDDLCEVPLYRRDGSLLFFAEGLVRYSNTGFQRNTFSSYSYYFLTEGDSPLSFPTLDEPSEASTDISKVKAYAINDNDQFVWYGGGRDFYNNTETRGGATFKLDLPGHVSGTETVYYDVSAQTSVGSSTMNLTSASSTSGSVNISKTITKTGEGETARGYRGSFSAALGETAQYTINTSRSGRLNYLYCAYTQTLSATKTQHAFSTSTVGSVNLHIAGASAGTRVWRLADGADNVAQVAGTLNGTTYTARATDGTSRFAIVDVTAAYPTPETVGEIAHQDLHADSAYDYIIIIPASGKLQAQAERLAEAHKAQSGLRVKIVRADQLYNEFSSGTPDATAYRRYIKMLYDRALTDADAPRYLLLMGDCTYDNRMITSEMKGASLDDYLLAYERNDQETYLNMGYSIGTLHSYVTDDYYGLLDDGEGNSIARDKIDLGIGRFLCHTEEDAKWLVDNTIDYLQGKHCGSWQNKIWAIADVGDNNLHMQDAQAVIKSLEAVTPTGVGVRRIFPDAYTRSQEAKGATYPAATKKLKQAMQQGALIFNYNGHGSPDRLSHNFLLDKADTKGVISSARPIWIFASCEITPYDQAIEDLGRNALFAANGPAIAVVCAARSVYSNYNRSLNQGFVKYAFSRDSLGRRYTFGDAMRLTKEELLTSSSNTIGTDPTINKLKYVLLGDPALTLRYPDAGVTIDSINGRAVTDVSLETLPVGGVVSFSGYVNADAKAGSADKSFQGSLTGLVMSPKETITCKGYGSSSALTYTDYTKTIYEGSVTVKDGRFKMKFMVPRGVKLSTDRALLDLYAVRTDSTSQLCGMSTAFCINGSAQTTELDTLGPSVKLYIGSPDFPSGGRVTQGSTLYAAIADSSSVSIVSGNLGHDMELWFDKDPSTMVSVNDYFAFNYDSYHEGLLTYPLPTLTKGRHRLTLRVWDVFDNSSTASLDFEVTNDKTDGFEVTAVPTITAGSPTDFITTFTQTYDTDRQVTTEVYDLAGMRIWHGESTLHAGSRYVTINWNGRSYGGAPLTRGVYLYRSSAGGDHTPTKKVVVR